MIECTFYIRVTMDDDFGNGTTFISASQTAPHMACVLLAAEHMVTAAAMDSPAGFDKALELIVEQARVNRVKFLGGRVGQNNA